jgi:hypothetical protein
MKHARDFNLVRESVLSTTLAPETPAFDIQQACGTGLEAAMLVANKIALGHIECGIAGGVDRLVGLALHIILQLAELAGGVMGRLLGRFDGMMDDIGGGRNDIGRFIDIGHGQFLSGGTMTNTT